MIPSEFPILIFPFGFPMTSVPSFFTCLGFSFSFISRIANFVAPVFAFSFCLGQNTVLVSLSSLSVPTKFPLFVGYKIKFKSIRQLYCSSFYKYVLGLD